MGYVLMKNRYFSDTLKKLRTKKKGLSHQMCKGNLTISPREGGGTSVKITIPEPEKQ